MISSFDSENTEELIHSSDSDSDNPSDYCKPCQQNDYYKNIAEMLGLMTLSSEKRKQLFKILAQVEDMPIKEKFLNLL